MAGETDVAHALAKCMFEVIRDEYRKGGISDTDGISTSLWAVSILAAQMILAAEKVTTLDRNKIAAAVMRNVHKIMNANKGEEPKP